MRASIGILAIPLLTFVAVRTASSDAPQARRVTGTVTRVQCKTGHVSVLAEGRPVDVELRRAKACHLKPGDRIAIWLPGEPAAAAPKWRDLRGDPGPPAAAIPPPVGYPLGPGMGPIGAGSPNAGPGSPVGADGAR